MASSSLRQQPFWQDLAKHFGQGRGFRLKEVGSDDFDLSVQASGVERATNVLLLDDTVIEAQLARLDSWLLRTHDVSRLVLLLGLTGQQPSRALQELQFCLLGKQALVTVLPVASVDHLIPTIKSFAFGLSASDMPFPKIRPSTVMPWATTKTPRKLLTVREVNTIQQLCGSIEGLEKATRMQEGRRHLEFYLGPDVAKAVFDFWDDEWIA